MILTTIELILGALGWVCAGWFYLHLWRWAKMCERAQVAVAYKRKSVLSASFLEWMLWSRNIPKGQTGRVVYQNRDTRVAILRPAHNPSPWRDLRLLVTRKPTKGSGVQVRQGTYAARDDKTGARGGN